MSSITTVGANSHVLVTLIVLCILPAIAMPILTKQEASDEILRKLKRGLLSADSVLYYSTEDLLQGWVKEDMNLEYSVIFQVVVSISNLMNSQQTLKNNMNSLQDDTQVETVAITLLVDAVLTDACNWLSDVLDIEDFNCTSTDIERLVSHIRAQQLVENMKVALKEYKRLKGLGSCNWIECNIWCNEEFRSMSNSAKVLKYILKYNDVGCDEFSMDADQCASCDGVDN